MGLRGTGLPGGWQLVERTLVGPADHLSALQLPQYLMLTLEGPIEGLLGQIVNPLPLLHLDVSQLLPYRGGDIAGQSPGGSSPHQQGLPVASAQGKAQED